MSVSVSAKPACSSDVNIVSMCSRFVFILFFFSYFLFFSSSLFLLLLLLLCHPKMCLFHRLVVFVAVVDALDTAATPFSRPSIIANMFFSKATKHARYCQHDS